VSEPPSRSHAAASPESLQSRFLELLPRIELHARICFRDVRCPQRRDDLVAEAVSLAWLWYVRLARRGKDAADFPSTLAGYAARAVRSGRRLCGQEAANDVCSPGPQRRGGLRVCGLPYPDDHGGGALHEALRDNTRSEVPEQAAFRLDFPAWLATLSRRDRRLLGQLMLGERTCDVARRFGVSAARVSQLRRRFKEEWEHFCAG
jgi:hypothetical protein